MWYILEYFNVDIFSFIVVYFWEKYKMRIICIHHMWPVQNHMQSLILFINYTCTPTLYYVYNKYYLPQFTTWPMILSLYNSSISDIYSFMFAIQSMIVKNAPNEKKKNEMACYLYPCGFLFATNIIIATIVVLLDFVKYSHYCGYNYWFNHHM